MRPSLPVLQKLQELSQVFLRDPQDNAEAVLRVLFKQYHHNVAGSPLAERDTFLPNVVDLLGFLFA